MSILVCATSLRFLCTILLLAHRKCSCTVTSTKKTVSQDERTLEVLWHDGIANPSDLPTGQWNMFSQTHKDFFSPQYFCAGINVATSVRWNPVRRLRNSTFRVTLATDGCIAVEQLEIQQSVRWVVWGWFVWRRSHVNRYVVYEVLTLPAIVRSI